MARMPFSDWSDEELFAEMALRQDRKEDTTPIAAAIRARGGNPFPTPEERNLAYEAQAILRDGA